MIGFIYIVALPQFIESNESVFKIGRSCDVFKKLKSYPKNTKLYFQIFCKKEVIKVLSEQFIQRTEFGRKYFEGPFSEIQKTITFTCASFVECKQ